MLTPQSWPSSMIGAPTTARTPSLRARTAQSPETFSKLSIRAGRPVSTTEATRLDWSSAARTPTGMSEARLPEDETTVTAPSGPQRFTPAQSAPSSCSTSAATASRTSLGETPRATNVATRRKAACSSAIRASSLRLSAFATAVATSSVNSTMRLSVSSGRGRSVLELTAKTPHSRPSTVIGAPTEERHPISRPAAAATPGSCE